MNWREKPYDLYHCSSEKEIVYDELGGVFGDFIFFSCEPYNIGSVESMWGLDLDDLSVIKATSMYYEDDAEDILHSEIQEVMRLCDVDEDSAFDIICEREQPEECDSEISWGIQRITAECARKLGYDGVAVRDEQGTSYMFPIPLVLKKMERIE